MLLVVWSKSRLATYNLPLRAGLGRPASGVGIKYNRNSLRLTIADPNRVLDAVPGRVLSISGYTRDAAAGLNVCFQAPIRVC